MVRFFRLAALAILLFGTVRPAVAQDITVGDKVVLHAASALAIPLHREARLSLFGRANDGTIGTVVETANDDRWFSVDLDNGPTAWIIIRYLEELEVVADDPFEATWLALAALGWPNPQPAFSGYDVEVRAALWVIYVSGGTTLYCRAQFTATDGANHRANGIALTWEHVFPANSMAAALGFSSRLCLGAAGEPRDLCLAAVADLHNLWPAYGPVNSSRRNHPFSELPGEGTNNPLFAEFCPDFERTYGEIPTYVEPTDAARGDIARSLIYMHYVYGLDLAAVIDDPNRLLQWLAADPVDALELERHSAIVAVQGTNNPLVAD